MRSDRPIYYYNHSDSFQFAHFYEIWKNVGFTVPRNKFLSVGRGKFYAKISRFRQQQLT